MFRKIILTLTIFSLLVLVLPAEISAKLPGEGVTLSPPIKYLTINPGETRPEKIKLTNPTNSLVEFYPLAMNFRAKGEGGEPDFYPASEESARFSLANWIKFSPTKVVLTPEQEVEWEYQIDVPEGAEPGGYYGVVFFASEPPKPDQEVTQVALATMIGGLHLVRVPGDIIEKGVLKEFSTQKFYFKPPVNFIVRISNLGNIHFKPKGEISVKNWRGKEVGELKINQVEGNILPNSTRRFEEKWSPLYKYFFEMPIGRFVGNLNATYGEDQHDLKGTVVFWIIPWWLIIILAAILVLITVLVWRKIRQIKRKAAQKKKIILR